MAAPALLEKYLFAVRKGGLRTAKTVDMSASPTVYLPSGVQVGAGVTYPNGVTTPTGGAGIYFGTGAPTINAAQGSLYLRSDGSSTSTRMYVNTNGTNGWAAVTTAT